jgi:hypothetical protein
MEASRNLRLHNTVDGIRNLSNIILNACSEISFRTLCLLSNSDVGEYSNAVIIKGLFEKFPSTFLIESIKRSV